MKQLSILLAAATVLSACGGSLTADEVRGVLPTSDSVKVGTPSGGQGSYVVAQRTDALATSAEYKTLTSNLALVVNGGVAFVLGVVKDVVESPATSCSGDTCTWGPGPGSLGALDPYVYKLVVTKRDSPALHYDWSLSAEPRFMPSGFVEIISGSAYPSGQKLHGNGTLSVDFDNAFLLGGASVGTLDVTYDNVDSVKVDCQLTDGYDVNSGSLNAAYSYTESASGGDLQIAAQYATYSVSLHSRWAPSGAGRGDASWSGTLGTFTRSECWSSADTGFVALYQLTTPTDPWNPDFGIELDDCGAFVPASFATITLP